MKQKNLTCPCGNSRLFEVGELTYAVRTYDMQNHDCSSVDYCDDEGYSVSVICAKCSRNITRRAVKAGWKIFRERSLTPFRR